MPQLNGYPCARLEKWRFPHAVKIHLALHPTAVRIPKFNGENSVVPSKFGSSICFPVFLDFSICVFPLVSHQFFSHQFCTCLTLVSHMSPISLPVFLLSASLIFSLVSQLVLRLWVFHMASSCLPFLGMCPSCASQVSSIVFQFSLAATSVGDKRKTTGHNWQTSGKTDGNMWKPNEKELWEASMRQIETNEEKS